jgi:hypothetical protein
MCTLQTGLLVKYLTAIHGCEAVYYSCKDTRNLYHAMSPTRNAGSSVPCVQALCDIERENTAAWPGHYTCKDV